MAQYKCKRCGNIIEVENGAIIAVCDNCLLAQPITAENVSVAPKNETVAKKSDVSSEIQTLLKRVYLFLEDEEWEKADEYCEKILDINPEFAEAYLGKIMTEFRVSKREDLINCEQSIKGNKYDKIMRFGDEKIKAEIKAVADAIENRIAPKTKPAEGYSLEQEEIKTEKYEKMVTKNKPGRLKGGIQTKKPSQKTLLISIIVLLAIVIPVSRFFSDQYAQYNPGYKEAVGLMESGEYYEAISAFALLDGYKDSEEKIDECRNSIYNLAVEAEEDSDKATAAILFGQAGDYKDAEERSFDLWDEIAVRETISAGRYHTVGLKKDGTVVATAYVGYSYQGQCDIEGWENIIAISAGDDHTVGLKKDGTVVAVGDNHDGQCDVAEWEDIVSISAGTAYTVGLKKDGTVVMVGSSFRGKGSVENWEDIIAVSAGVDHTVGLKKDGTVVATTYRGTEYDHYNGQCDVGYWEDVVSISVGWKHTVGLKKDGTVVAVGDDDSEQCNVESWKYIVAISAGVDYAVGLKKDGTVVAAGDNHYGQCDVEGWEDIVAISAGDYHAVGLKKDGTVVATVYIDDYYNGQCDVETWSDIKMP